MGLKPRCIVAAWHFHTDFLYQKIKEDGTIVIDFYDITTATEAVRFYANHEEMATNTFQKNQLTKTFKRYEAKLEDSMVLTIPNMTNSSFRDLTDFQIKVRKKRCFKGNEENVASTRVNNTTGDLNESLNRTKKPLKASHCILCEEYHDAYARERPDYNSAFYFRYNSWKELKVHMKICFDVEPGDCNCGRDYGYCGSRVFDDF